MTPRLLWRRLEEDRLLIQRSSAGLTRRLGDMEEGAHASYYSLSLAPWEWTYLRRQLYETS